MQAWLQTKILLAAVICALVGAGAYYFSKYIAPAGMIALKPHGFAAAYLIPSDDSKTTITAYFPFGEMDNTGSLGIAHYVEHLAWHNAFADAPVSNTHSNAYTTIDHTAYWLETPRADLVPSLKRLAKIVSPLQLDADFAVQEIQIVAREYEFAVADNPHHDIGEQFFMRHYAGDSRARSIIGTPQTIAAFTLEEARKWHAATHQRGRATVVIMGDHSKSEAEDALSTVLDLPSDPLAALPPRAPIDLAAREEGVRVQTSDKLPAAQLYWSRLANGPTGLSAAQALAQIDLLFAVLDSTLDGSLAGPLRFDARIAQSYDFSVYLVTPDQASMTITAARPDTGYTPQTLSAAIDTTLADIAARGIPAATFERIQTRILRDLRAEDDHYLTDGFIAEAVGARRAPFDAAQYRAAIQAARVTDLNRWLAAFAAASTVADAIVPATPSLD